MPRVLLLITKGLAIASIIVVLAIVVLCPKAACVVKSNAETKILEMVATPQEIEAYCKEAQSYTLRGWVCGKPFIIPSE